MTFTALTALMSHYTQATLGMAIKYNMQTGGGCATCQRSWARCQPCCLRRTNDFQWLRVSVLSHGQLFCRNFTESGWSKAPRIWSALERVTSHWPTDMWSAPVTDHKGVALSQKHTHTCIITDLLLILFNLPCGLRFKKNNPKNIFRKHNFNVVQKSQTAFLFCFFMSYIFYQLFIIR